MTARPVCVVMTPICVATLLKPAATEEAFWMSAWRVAMFSGAFATSCHDDQ